MKMHLFTDGVATVAICVEVSVKAETRTTAWVSYNRKL